MLKALPFTRTLCCSAAAILFAACSSNDPEQLGSVHVKSQNISANQGGTVEVTAQDNYPTLLGTKVVVPANALSKDTVLTIGISDTALSDDDTDGAGPVVELGPSGTQFASPVEISLPYTAVADEDLIRILVVQNDGTKEVILPEAITFDAATNTARFTISHFTRFQGRHGHHPCANVICPNGGTCRHGHCTPRPASCDPANCGPQPGVPSWTCADGTAGGSTSRCVLGPDGSCSWEVIWCPRQCDPTECGPRPAQPNYVCADGSTAGPTGQCLRDANGGCGWEIRQCPSGCSPNSTGSPVCPDGTLCDPNTGRCENNGGACGRNTCASGEICCSASCGICGAAGAPCPTIACNPCDNTTCPDPNQQCDPATGRCQPVCDPNNCGPRPGTPNWICSDGSTGGPTGRCVPSADGTCGWEINWCPRQCDPANDCGPAPASPCANTSCDRDPAGVCRWSACTRPCDPAECPSPRPGAPNTMCSDGSTGGPVCSRDATSNACGWHFRNCPP